LRRTAAEVTSQAPSKDSAKSLLEAYIHAAFNLTYNCAHPVRLPGPVQPGIMGDGGYVVCDDFWRKDNCSLFSFGIASDDTFELQVAAKYGCEVHEFDPTVNGSAGANSSDLVHFHRIGCWDKETTLSIGPVDSVQSLLHRFHTKNTHLSLKMDVEGSEWTALPAIPDSILNEFDHVILEIHTRREPPSLNMVQTLARLREKFYLFHYNINNCCADSPAKLDSRSGLGVPGPVELSFLRKDLVQGVPTGPFDLHEELNARNVLSHPAVNSTVMPKFGWDRAYDENWEAYAHGK